MLLSSFNISKIDHRRKPPTSTKMKSYPCIAVFAVFSLSVSAQIPLQDICNNQPGYHPHPTECDKFIQCRYTNGNIIVGEVLPCSFPSYWDDSLLTCVSVNDKVCATDRCVNMPTGTTFPGDGNCRGYWNCTNGVSVPMCCPQGQKYMNASVGCVDNEIQDECNDTCMNDEYVFMNETTVELCDKEMVPDQPSMFGVRVPGFPFPVLMMCAPGTVYNNMTCNCTVPSVEPEMVRVEKECRPEVFLTFDNTSVSMTGKTKHITPSNVLIEDGKARFNGLNSRFTIPRFNNVENLETIVIKVNYTSEHSKKGIARAIISNSGENCNIPSILISEDETNIYFGAGTTNGTRAGSFNYTYLAQDNQTMDGEMTSKSVVYKINNDRLSGHYGNNSIEVSAPGSLLNVHCDLHIGYAKDLAPFDGEIESLEIYLCDPDDM